jgi:putative membrane-bound dehydrogenase-like protein
VIELVAKEPAIVTPTGIAVDESCRIWIIENNTHERPPNYSGATSDRVRVFSDFDHNGKLTHISTFAEGFKNSMGLTLGKRGEVYLVTRSQIYLLRDTKGQGVADEQKTIVKLDTTATYPHNGLSGFAWDGLDNLYFGLGENRGADYKLIGADGAMCSGGGEGGSIYRCRPDGTGLVRVATGFWNPFGLTVDAFGRLFAVDNDPDSRGPCRLMHIIQGGDYGYRYRNGRKGLHPFTAWNGELPGTLPMVAGTGEAPCGVVAYESTGLPAEYRGDLLVASWGDHVIERFRLKNRGASFSSKAETIVRGGEDFRPVGMATAPDGSLYISDWVDKSYPVHGKGRIWRLRMKTPPKDDGLLPSQVQALDKSRLPALLSHPKQTIRRAAGDALAKTTLAAEVLTEVVRKAEDSRARVEAIWSAAKAGGDTQPILVAYSDPSLEVRAEAIRLIGLLSPKALSQNVEGRMLVFAPPDSSAALRLQAIPQLKSKTALESIVPALADQDPFIAAVALDVLGRPQNQSLLAGHAHSSDPRIRTGILLALRRTGEARSSLPAFLKDPDPGVRRAAIQWVGEEGVHEYADLARVAASLPPITREVFEAYLATLDFLSGNKRKPEDEPSGDEFIAKMLTDGSQPAAIRVLSLRLIRSAHPVLTASFLKAALADKDADVRAAAVRILATRNDEACQAVLRGVAANDNARPSIQSFAILGLANSASESAVTRRLLVELAKKPATARDALRSLRSVSLRPGESADLLRASAGPHPTAGEDREVADQLALLLNQGHSGTVDVRPAKGADGRVGPPGDPTAGEIIFFHSRGPRCFACHRIDGRGGAIGPDLSYIGRSMSREKIIESIRTPSKEIAPQFTSWQIITRDGKVHIGMMVEEGPHSTVTLADNQGKLETFHRSQIEERHSLPTSIMPDKLEELMTRQEFRDLIEFLCERK